jgi:hypothetical protein
MPTPETGKQRAERIPLDYYTRPGPVVRVRSWLGGLALLGAVAWPVLGWVAQRPGLQWIPANDYHFAAPAPVAQAHAIWEADCGACHTPWTPIRGSGWQTDVLGCAANGSDRCQTCHAGPLHHAKQEPNDLACASCHLDHQGRDASLVRVPDSKCRQCHDDLTTHTKGGNSTFEPKVHSWAEHPPFRIDDVVAKRRVEVGKAVDGSKLKFNHKLHLSAGMKTPEKGDPHWTLADIPEPYRKRYIDQQPADMKKETDCVQLQCSACHVPDSGDYRLNPVALKELPAAALLPPRSAGAYMLPITYENQCQACHPLTFGAGPRTLRHRLQPDQIRTFLDGYFTAQVLQQNPEVFSHLVPKQPGPGKPVIPEEMPSVLKVIRAKVEIAEEQLYLGKNNCRLCHHEVGKEGFAGKGIEPTAVPTVWFPHAQFDHTAHRAVQCKECHAAAETSLTNLDVLLPTRETCQSCHGPKIGTKGGARSDCVECHRYHHGDKPLQGAGAQMRGVAPKDRLKIDDFLKVGK